MTKTELKVFYEKTLQELEYRNSYINDKSYENRYLFLCRIIKNFKNTEFANDFFERLNNILDTDPDLILDNSTRDKEWIAYVIKNESSHIYSFWQWNDFENRAEFLSRIISRLEDDE